MPKTLGLDVVIGASVGTAIKSIELVTNSTKVLGATIDKLNSKKLTILESIDKEFKAKFEPIESELKKFYDKQKDIKLKLKVKDEELNELNKKIKNTEKEIKSLEKEKLNLEKQFKKGKISAEEFETKTKEIEKELTKLQKKKLGLESKLEIVSKKATLLKNSLSHVNNTIDKLKNKKLKLKDELEAAKEEAIKTNKELKKIGSVIESINKRKVKIQTNIEKRENLKKKFWDTLAIGTTIAAPFKAGIEFESEMARVKALSGANKEEFKKLEETAKKLGSTTVFSASEAAKGMQFLAMAGYKTNQIVKAMPGLLDLAAAGQTDLATTADITSNILSGFRLSADKTTHVADVLAKAMTTANVDIGMLGETMKYVGPAAAGLGDSLESVTTLTALLGNAGVQASNAGTALRSMYLRMASPPAEALKVIQKLGIQTKDANGNFIGMVNIIKQLQEKTKGLSNTQIADIMKKLFGTEAVSAAMVLLKEPIEKINKYEKALQNADGTAKKIAKTQTDTVAGSFKALGSAIEGLSISFSTLFLPVVKKATESITWLTQKLNNFIQEHKTLATILGGAVAGFGVLTVASFALGYAATFVANAYHKSIVVVKLLQSAFILLVNEEKRASFWSAVLDKKTKLITFSKKTWALATMFLSKSLNFLGRALKLAGKGALWFLTTLKKGVILGYNTALKVLSWSAVKAKLAFNFLGKSLLFVGSKLRTAGIYAYNMALKVLNFTAKLTSNALKFAGRSLLWLGRAMLTNPIGIAITAIAAGAYLIYSNWDKLKGFFGNLWDRIKAVFAKGIEFIANVFVAPITFIKKGWDAILGWISSKIKWVASVAGKIKSFFGFGDDKKELNISKEEKKELTVPKFKVPQINIPKTQTPTTIQPISVKEAINNPQIINQSTNNQYTNNHYIQQPQITNNQHTNTPIHQSNNYTININITGTNSNEIIDKIKVILPHLIEEIEENRRERALSDTV